MPAHRVDHRGPRRCRPSVCSTTARRRRRRRRSSAHPSLPRYAATMSTWAPRRRAGRRDRAGVVGWSSVSPPEVVPSCVPVKPVQVLGGDLRKPNAAIPGRETDQHSRGHGRPDWRHRRASRRLAGPSASGCWRCAWRAEHDGDGAVVGQVSRPRARSSPWCRSRARMGHASRAARSRPAPRR